LPQSRPQRRHGNGRVSWKPELRQHGHRRLGVPHLVILISASRQRALNRSETFASGAALVLGRSCGTRMGYPSASCHISHGALHSCAARQGLRAVGKRRIWTIGRLTGCLPLTPWGTYGRSSRRRQA